MDTKFKNHEKRTTILHSKKTHTSEYVDTPSEEFHAFKKDLTGESDTTLDAKFETLLAKINGVNAKGAKGRGRPEQAENVAPPSVGASRNSQEQRRSRSARGQQDKQQPEAPDQPVALRRGRSMVRAHP